MDKHSTITKFNKWFSSINLTTLSKVAQKEIAYFNEYAKKYLSAEEISAIYQSR